MNKGDHCFLQSRQQYQTRDRNEEFEDELNTLFNKKFQFRFNDDWKLPGVESWFSTAPWKVGSLERLKSRLNFQKSQLNDFDIEEWSSHTRRRNPAGEVCWKLRCMVNPEFLTQAWTKFYECACSYNIIPMQAVADREMVSLHLCEAPGAFITSLNHYLKQNHADIQWKWLANTLNPYYEGNSLSNMISDDRFMFHTLHHWDFGVDNTGNLMNWTNSQAIVRNAKALGKVLLVTADGSIDCVQKPDAQEEATSPLHYCEIVTALHALSIGGTLIFKLFTTFEHSTVGLLYLINHLFSEVNIYKPVTSRQGNSEVYAVCLDYKGRDILQPFIPKLQSAYGTKLYEEKSLFPIEQIPESFLKQIDECAYYFSTLQCQVINNNLQAYLMQNTLFSLDIKKIRGLVANEYLRLYNLKPLKYEQEVLKGLLHQENKVNTNPRYHRGSYTERQLYSNMSLKGKCKSLTNVLKNDLMPMQIFINTDIMWKEFYDTQKLDLAFTVGLPLEKVNSSKFVYVPMFKLYQQICAEPEFMDIIQLNYLVDCLHYQVKDAVKLAMPDMVPMETYDEYEKLCFLIYTEIVKSMTVGQTLVMSNMAVLTQFHVSVLFVICKCFERVGFTPVNSIVFSNLLSTEGLECIDTIEAEYRRAERSGRALLNCLPVNVTNVGEFFSSIVRFNNSFFRNRCKEYLAVIDQALCNVD